MIARWNAAAAALVLGLTLAAIPAAQGQDKKNDKDKAAADQCKLDFGSPDALRSGYNTVTILQLGSNKPEDAKRRLKGVVSDLTRSKPSSKDQLPVDFTLGAALVLSYEQLGEPATVKRGDVGYATDAAGTIDLLAAADTAFTAVESAQPECQDRTDYYRQRPWVKMINQVGPLLNREKLDSASALLNRSMVIYRGSPFSYYFLGQIANRKQDWPAAAAAFSKATELATPEAAAKDTNVASVKEYSEFSAAFASLKAADAMQGDQRKGAMAKAAELYRAYLKDYPSGPNEPPARAGLAAALKASGDTASLATMWTDMAANPSHYSDAQLLDAGTQAFTANNIPMAVKLMAAGNEANPYLRGGLFNLANAYWKANAFDKMLPVTQRLLEVDPDNPDNYQLVAIAYQGLGKGTTDAKAKKAYSDSVTKYVMASEKLPVKVDFSQFTRDADTFTLAGTVENIGTAAKTVKLDVEFLDIGGKPVVSQSTTLTLQPKQKAPFSLKADGKTIKAFRYAAVK